MKLKKYVPVILSSLMIVGSNTQAMDDFTTPYINPARDCISEGMINPEGKEFRYLFSKDCRAVYVMPPAVIKQDIKSQGLNMQVCPTMRISQNSIAEQTAKIDEAEGRLRQYEKQLDAATSKVVEDRLKKKIQEQTERLVGYRAVLEESSNSHDKRFGQTPGAKFSIAMVGNVSATELNQIRALNLANLNRIKEVEVRKTGPDGNEIVEKYQTVLVSSLRPAPISSSYFSFDYKVPEKSIQNGGIISTSIPGLEYLTQLGGRTGTLHVKANDAVSGDVLMALTASCDYVSMDENNQPVFDSNKADPFFTVSRTFEVQQMFAQGYTASLKVDKVVDQISSYLSTETEGGFHKSSVFNPIIKANIDELLDFTWVTEYETGSNVAINEILAIKQTITEKFIDDYVEKLVAIGLVTIEPDKQTSPAHGGYVDETRLGHRCWTERKNWFGGRKNVCSDFTYTVKVWKDGITKEDLHRHLTVDANTVEQMTINKMTPFYFTTAFRK